MKTPITIIGIIGFFISLYVMYRTKHGIPGIQKYDSSFKLLDMQFRYNASTVYTTFENIGEYGRKAYSNYLLLDFCFITCFLIVQLAITKAVVSKPSFQSLLLLLVALRAAFDVAENSILLYIINRYPTKYVALAEFCSWVTTAKFVMLYLWISGIIIILFTILVRNVVK